MNRFFVQFEAFVYMNPPHSRIPAVYSETDEESWTSSLQATGARWVETP